MKTEFDYGFEYAKFLVNDVGEDVGPVKIEEMLTGSSDIPNDDYRTMTRNWIKNPDARKYWEGYNSYFQE